MKSMGLGLPDATDPATSDCESMIIGGDVSSTSLDPGSGTGM